MEKWDIILSVIFFFFQQAKGECRGEWEMNKRKGKGDEED